MLGLRFFNAWRTRVCLFGLLVVGVPGSAAASIVLDGTRVIFDAAKSDVSVRMRNEGDGPKLVQVWIDDGDKKASPEQIKVPFVVLTPIFRVDAKKGQVARIRYLNNEAVVSNRESVFWLNVLEIPPTPTTVRPDENYLQFRYRTRVKLFYRPAGLPGTAADASKNLIFRYQPGAIQIENPSAYHVSISSLDVGVDARGGKAGSEMIAPFTTKRLPLQGSLSGTQPPLIRYRTINDFGGIADYEKRAAAF